MVADKYCVIVHLDRNGDYYCEVRPTSEDDCGFADFYGTHKECIEFERRVIQGC